MGSGIYAIRNKENNKMYIGQSVNMGKRIQYHKTMLRNGKHFNPKLQNAFNKHGESRFEVVSMLECTKGELNQKEIEFIDKFNTTEEGYNICEGGNGSTGRPMSVKTKAKISRANKGRVHSKESRQRKSIAAKRMWKDPKHRKKIIKSRANNPDWGAWNIGTVKTDEEKEAISKKMMGRHITEEHKQKLHNLYKGENSLTAKLTKEQVIEIRLRFLKGEKQFMIQEDYPVTRQTIYDIVRNRRWKHIPNTIEELEILKKTK